MTLWRHLKKKSLLFWHLLSNVKTSGRFFSKFCDLFRKPELYNYQVSNRLITLHCQNYANNDYFSMEESYHIYLSCFKACLRLKKKKKVIVPYSLVKIWGTTLWNLACMVFLDRSKSSAIPDVCLISMPWTNRPGCCCRRCVDDAMKQGPIFVCT